MKQLFFISMCFVALLFSENATCQINIKIGYTVGNTFPKANNQFIGDFNTAIASIYDDYQPMKDLGFMYGITLGLRYGMEIGSLEFTWERLASDRKSLGITRTFVTDPMTMEQILQSSTATAYELNYVFNQFMFTYESRFGIWGVGSSIGMNRASISSPTNVAEEKDLLSRDNQFFTRFHISVNFEGNSSVAIALKPFFQLPLTDISIKSAAELLGTNTNDTSERFPMLGLSLIFYNGPQ